MSIRLTITKCLALCLGVTFLLACFIASLPLPETEASPRAVKRAKSSRKLAIIVPFRDRFEELLDFVPHMHNFLTKQGVNYHIFVIQQRDNYRFNRASLINVGFLYTRNNFDYIAMHDVDLLPLNPHLSYGYPGKGPFHISGPELHPRYNYATFIGGILLINRDHFEQIGGMSNRYWGWGLEDDEFYVRIKNAGLFVQRPIGIETGRTDTFKHIHDRSHRRRDTRKCYNQKEVTTKRDRQTGLHDVDYRLDKKHEITIDGLPLTVVNVYLNCNQTITPWCLCPDPPKLSNKTNSNTKKLPSANK